ncbi:LisH domain-like protein [Hirschfeldia incana]|nr:LisH domain-like protein [Hirschfeldia incana]
MDFDSLTRRDLQFFCKRNKIPANMTNIAMADALKALEIVEGVEEFMNQTESTRDLSPTSVAKNMPSAARTAARTTRRKTKDETQPSELVTRSCLVTSKSLAGEMEQENRNTNVDPALPPSRRRAAVTSVAMNLEESKTPAVRSTRRGAQAAAVSESVQRVYSTRRSVKLLEESMADLSLKTNVPSKKKEDAESEGSKLEAKSEDSSEKTQEGEEAISVRDLNDSWDDLKNDPDVDVLYGDLGDITFVDASTCKEQMNGAESNTVPAPESSVLVEDQATSEEDGFVTVDHAASTTANIVTCSKESESEEMKNDSESESEDDVVADTSQEAFGSKVTASDNVTKVDTVPTVVQAEESEESCETDEPMDDELAIVSDKKTHASSPQESDSDEWSDYEISEIDEKSLINGETIDSESEESSFSDKKSPASSSSVLAAKETKTPLNVKDNNTKNEENVEEMMVLDNNGEREAETKKKKNMIDEESLKDVSMRQLTKMVKELAIKNKQQHKSLE